MDKKQKAQKLVDDFTFDIRPFSEHGEWDISHAKKCACISIDQMIEFKESLFFGTGSLAHQYLLEIKQEIEKI
jgi:hypothetical protein